MDRCCELLVHVSAPATVRHDRRQLALAQAIVDFQPGSLTSVTSSEDDHRSTLTANSSNSSLGLRRRQPLKRARTLSSAFPNPPYRNPYHGSRGPRSLKSPAPSDRPHTSPETIPHTIQVPRTHSQHRRALSDSCQDVFWDWSNSPENQVPETCSERDISSPLADRDSIVSSLSQTSLDDQPARKRLRLQATILGQPVVMPRPSGSEAFFLRDRSLDWTSPPSPSTSAPTTLSGTSTATPSQPSQGSTANRPYSSHATPVKSPSIVLLSSGSSDTANAALHSMQQPNAVKLGSECHGTASMPFARLDSLPQEVSSPPPPVGRGKFSSHITEPLQELMDALPFQKLFKPLTVARDVKVLERGHWLLEITIARDDHVADARASPTKQEAMQAYSDRFAGATAEERLAKFWQAKSAGVMSDYDFGHEDGAVGKWTEAEFVTFWNNFAGLLCKAKAGWAVRMVRDDVAWGLQQAGTRMVRIRIFTWGEIVGHIYLAIWLSSDKLSVRIPMKWVAGDGQAVIEMSGKKKHKGRLPSWIRKGPEGERGSWGLAAEEEPT